MPTRQQIVAEARTWLDTRYLHQGRRKGVGVDCIGLAGMVALATGVAGAQEWYADQTMHCYGITPDPDFLWAACNRFLDPIAPADATLADLLVMAFPRQPQHFAVVSRVQPTYVIHAYLQRRKVVENSLPIARSKVIAAYKFRGVV